MEIEMSKKESVNVKRIFLNLKVCDEFSFDLLDENGNIVYERGEGYVPDFFPGRHFGDYVYLDIDLETGKILNWKSPSKLDLETLIGEE